MSLQLSIKKYPSSEVVTQLSHCFDKDGGTIGRAEKNDWVLPDKERYVSSKHALVRFHEGNYELVDKSTNGVYLNHSEDPIGADRPIELRNGDSLTIGGYEIQVNLMLAENGFSGVDLNEAENVMGIAKGAPSTPPSTEFPAKDVEHVALDESKAIDDLDHWLEPDHNAGLPWENNRSENDELGIDEANGEPYLAEDSRVEGEKLASIESVSGLSSGQNELMDIVNANAQELDPLALLDVAAGDEWQGASQPQDLDPINEPLQLGGLIPDDWDDEPLLQAPVDAVATSIDVISGNSVDEISIDEALDAKSLVGWHSDEDSISDDDNCVNGNDIPANRGGPSPQFKNDIPKNLPEFEPPQFEQDKQSLEAITPVGKSVGDNVSPNAVSIAQALSIVQALGLDAHDLNPEQLADLNDVVGGIVKESVGGLMQVLGARAAIKNEFRMAATLIQSAENNPLKFSVSLEEAMENLFVRRSKAYKGAVESIQDGFQDVKDHQLAMLTGMRAAFNAMFGRFDPEKLQHRFEGEGISGMTAVGRKAKYWDAFSTLYQSWAEDQDRVFHELFGEDFVEAYEEQMDTLK